VIGSIVISANDPNNPRPTTARTHGADEDARADDAGDPERGQRERAERAPVEPLAVALGTVGTRREPITGTRRKPSTLA
jgi:hypothetical protein